MANGVGGSGTLVGVAGDAALVLTCRHVTEREGYACELFWRNGEKTNGWVASVPAPVQGNEFSNDLALVICERPKGVKPVPVVKFNPDDGPFYSIGYRRGELLMAVSRTAKEPGDGLIRMSAPILPGLSGGLTCNRFGQQVGVCVGGEFDQDIEGNIIWIGDQSVSADGEHLTKLLEGYR